MQLRIDTCGFAIDMPVDHDARLAIARMPFGQSVLIPRAEVAGIGRAGRNVIAPELGESRLKEPIDDGRNTLAYRLWGDKAAAHIDLLYVSS